jgi:hypothetical protein
LLASRSDTEYASGPSANLTARDKDGAGLSDLAMITAKLPATYIGSVRLTNPAFEELLSEGAR